MSMKYFRSAGRWMVLGMLVAPGCRPSSPSVDVPEHLDAAAPRSEAPRDWLWSDADTTSPVPLTLVARGPQLCSLTLVAASGFGDRATAHMTRLRTLEERLRLPVDPVCLVAMRSELRGDFVAFFAGATLDGSTRVTAGAVDALATHEGVFVSHAVGVADLLANLESSGSRFTSWAGAQELEQGQLASASLAVVARLEGPRLESSPLEPPIARIELASGHDGLWMSFHGQSEDLAAIEQSVRAGLHALATGTAGEDPHVASMVEALALEEAHAQQRITVDPSPGRLRIRLRSELTPHQQVFAAGAALAIVVASAEKARLRARTAEARLVVGAIYDAAVNAMYESPGQLSTFIGCPTSREGESGITPPLGTHCAWGPAGRCLADDDDNTPGAYRPSSWTDNPLWTGLGFELHEPHHFHYSFRWRYDAEEHGCQFTAQAFGDLDDDGVFSTFERAGAASVHGVNTAGLYIDREIE